MLWWEAAPWALPASSGLAPVGMCHARGTLLSLLAAGAELLLPVLLGAVPPTGSPCPTAVPGCAALLSA